MIANLLAMIAYQPTIESNPAMIANQPVADSKPTIYESRLAHF
jgi:hypothetical protein